MAFNTTTMHFKLVFLVICAIAFVACEARGSGYTRVGQDVASTDQMKRDGSEERRDFGIQELKYKPRDTYDQNTGRGRRIPNAQGPRYHRSRQQSGSGEAANGIYRENNW